MTTSVDKYQNPLWPDDKQMSVAQMEVRARKASFARAQSPGERVCKLDSVFDQENPGHIHGSQEFMDYRHNHVVGDYEPWSYWLTYDRWAELYEAPPPPPPEPPLPIGWFPRARVNQTGIPIMSGWGQGWIGYSFVTVIGPSRFQPIGPGNSTRITLCGDCVMQNVFAGPMTATPWVARVLHPLTFGSSLIGTTSLEPDWKLVSDPLPFGLDAANGIMVSGLVIAGHSNPDDAWLQNEPVEADMYSRWIYGAFSGDLDKSKAGDGEYTGWADSGVANVAVLMIEGYYEPEPLPI